MISQYYIFIKNWLRMLLNLKFDNHIVMYEKDIYFIKYFSRNLNKLYWYKIHFQILTSDTCRKSLVWHGELYREDGPAIIRKNGSYAWYLNGVLHREDGPAVEHVNGSRAWYLNGKLHREDGPAIIRKNGSYAWYLNGELHRKDGPAIEYPNGRKYWYLNGKEYSEKEFHNILISELPKLNITFN